MIGGISMPGIWLRENLKVKIEIFNGASDLKDAKLKLWK